MQHADNTINSSHKSFYDDGKGINSWLFTMDHKRLGLNYLVVIVFFFVIAATIGLLMKIELTATGRTLMGADTYNVFFTFHGVIMLFLVVIPSVPAIFGNFFMPIMIGAKDVSFPRINLLSWWFLVVGAILALVSLWSPQGFADTGWTFYVPYSTGYSKHNIVLSVFSVFLLGVSSMLTGINFLTTIHRLRAPGMTWFKVPLFVWGIYGTAWIQVLATPIIALTLLLIILEKYFGAGIFDPAKGGDPILYQHLFWIYSHPAVYIMVLPAMGIISEVIPVFARKVIFGYKYIALSSLGIALFGSLVWAHHMFVSGMSDTARWAFSLLTFLVAIPSAIKVFNWVATLYKGSIDVKTPLLYSLAFIYLFSLGGVSGLVQGTLNTNVHIHDTYFVVAHLHYVIFGGTIMGIFAGIHYWFPKMFGRMYNAKYADLAFLLIFVGFNLLYFTMYIMGLEGMPRRSYDYLPEFTTINVISSIGAFILYPGLILMIVNLLIALKKGEKAEMNPWGGLTLEWQVPSPPSTHNFDEIPVITKGPQEFNFIPLHQDEVNK